MDKKLAELIKDYEMVIVGIGSEWNWIKKGIREDERYSELLEFAKNEDNKWLVPVIEFEYGYYHNNTRVDEAFRGLRKLIGEKSYFLVCDTFLQDAVFNGFDEALSVFPCGTYRYLQTNDPSDDLLDVTICTDFTQLVDKIHRIIVEDKGVLKEGEHFSKPFGSAW